MYQLFVIECLLLTIVYSTKGSLLCKEEPCSCCRSGKCSETYKFWQHCQGCIDGYSGLRCNEPCPKGCVNCSQIHYYASELECYQCKAGFYNGKYKDIASYPLQLDCSLPCIENCEMCTSFYICTRCKSQFYLGNLKECMRCPGNCLQCTSGTDCLVCEDGHAWDGKFCAACPANCLQCTSGSDCLACLDGYFWDGVKCVTCEAGYFGKNCSERCPDNCQCHRSTGMCIFCNDGYFMNQNNTCQKCPEHCNDCVSNELCLTCSAGYMGISCNNTCSSCMPGTVCHLLFEGICPLGCKNGFSGEECNLPCPSNCSICEREYPYICVSCASDRYGIDMNCINRCSVNCINNTCSDTDGKCTVGCEHGYWGDKCEYSCSKDCLDAKCNRSDGSCCLSGHLGFTSSKGPDNKEKISTAVYVVSTVAVTATVCFVLFSTVCCLLIRKGLLTLNIQLPKRWKQCRWKRSETTNSSDSPAPSDEVTNQ